MFDNFFTKKQLNTLKARQDKLGPEKINQAQNRWPELINEVQQAMKDNKQTDDPEVINLALEWQNLIKAFSGGCKQIESNLAKAYQANPNEAQNMGLDSDLMAFISQAMSHIR